MLLAEFDKREGWASWGARSCAHWLSWRCGTSGGTAREHVRVARALCDLPMIRAEFAAGRLTYSKVRALTRIATPALEAELVELGLGMPAGHVERVVRSYRRALDRENPPVPAPSTLTRRWDDDGSLIVTVRLGSDEGALVVAALEAYGAVLDAEQSHHAAGSVELPDAASLGVPGDQDEAAVAEAEADGTEAECQVLQTRRSRGPVAEAEALLALVTAALASGPTDRSGADRFEVVLRADLDQLAAMTQPGDPAAASTDAALAGAVRPDIGRDGTQPSTTSLVSNDAEACLRHGRCHLRDGPAVPPEILWRIACEAQIRLLVHGPDGSPRDVGRRYRLVTVGLRALLEERDHGRCRFPTCSRRRRLHAHHVVHWAHGGATDLHNLILLCPFHHQLVHEHGYAITTPTPGSFSFWRPDGASIDSAPTTSGHGHLHLLDPALHEAPAITDETTTPEWWGDPLHVTDVVDGLLRMRDHAAQRTQAGAGTATDTTDRHDDVPAGTAHQSHDPWAHRASDQAQERSNYAAA